MLSDRDQEQLVQLLVSTAEVVGDQITAGAAVLMVQDLSTYPLPMLAQALSSCRRELKGRLTLAAVLERVPDGHPAPNEAWAQAIRAEDEGATVVWTEQTRDAWNAAQPLVLAGDKIAARLAFIDVYARLVKQARATGQMATCHASIGHDPASRDAVLRDALQRGLLQHDQVAEHLALPPAKPTFNPMALIAGRVEVLPGASATTRKRLEEISALLGEESEESAAPIEPEVRHAA